MERISEKLARILETWAIYHQIHFGKPFGVDLIQDCKGVHLLLSCCCDVPANDQLFEGNCNHELLRDGYDESMRICKGYLSRTSRRVPNHTTMSNAQVSPNSAQTLHRFSSLCPLQETNNLQTVAPIRGFPGNSPATARTRDLVFLQMLSRKTIDWHHFWVITGRHPTAEECLEFNLDDPNSPRFVPTPGPAPDPDRVRF